MRLATLAGCQLRGPGVCLGPCWQRPAGHGRRPHTRPVRLNTLLNPVWASIQLQSDSCMDKDRFLDYGILFSCFGKDSRALSSRWPSPCTLNRHGSKASEIRLKINMQAWSSLLLLINCCRVFKNICGRSGMLSRCMGSVCFRLGVRSNQPLLVANSCQTMPVASDAPPGVSRCSVMLMMSCCSSHS